MQPNLSLFRVENILYVNISYMCNFVQLPVHEIFAVEKFRMFKFCTGGSVRK